MTVYEGASLRRFGLQRVFEIFETATYSAVAAVPELEGVAIVALWRLPDQASIPSTLVVGARGPLTTPDQLARLSLATARLQQHLANAYGDSLLQLREIEARLAGIIHEQKAALGRLRADGTAAATAPAQEARVDAAAAAAEVHVADEPRQDR